MEDIKKLDILTFLLKETTEIADVGILAHQTILNLMQGDSIINDIQKILTFYEETSDSVGTPRDVQVFIIMCALTIIMVNQTAEMRIDHLKDNEKAFTKLMMGIQAMGMSQRESILQVFRAVGSAKAMQQRVRKDIVPTSELKKGMH